MEIEGDLSYHLGVDVSLHDLFCSITQDLKWKCLKVNIDFKIT